MNTSTHMTLFNVKQLAEKCCIFSAFPLLLYINRNSALPSLCEASHNNGGGEDNETPLDAAKRETFEEGGIRADGWIELKSLAYLPVTIISEERRQHWSKDTYVIPEYAFGFACCGDIRLSHEHTEYIWMTYEEAICKLKWDSNRTALYELNCRLAKKN